MKFKPGFTFSVAFLFLFLLSGTLFAADTLEATFVPANDKPSPGQPFSFAVKVTNNGSEVTNGNRVSVSRHNVSPGGSVDGYGVKLGGFSGQSIENLVPGKTGSYDFTDQRPMEGTYLYRIAFANGGNYRTTEMKVKFVRPQAIRFTNNGRPNAAVLAEFNTNEQYPQPNHPFLFKVKVTNNGTAPLSNNSLAISKHTVSGGSASGYGSLIGGSGGSQQIQNLGPGQSAYLEFNDSNTPEGTYVYRMKFSSPGSYRQQEMTVTFSGTSEIAIR